MPHVTLVAVTDWQSVLKPCGCTPDLQKGGIERIGNFVVDLRKQDDSVLVVHAGSLLADPESMATPSKKAQFEQRVQAFVQALVPIAPAAVAFSSLDQEIGGDAVQAAYAAIPWPVLGVGPSSAATKRQLSIVLKTKSGLQVGILAVDPAMGDDFAVAKTAGDEVDRLRRRGAQVVVALSNLGLRSSRKLARAVPALDAVVVGRLEERTEPELDLEQEGNTAIVHATRHGAYVSTLTLAPQSQQNGEWADASAWLPGVAVDLQSRIEALDKRLAGLQQHPTVALQQALPFIEAERADLDKRRQAAVDAKGKPLPQGRLRAWRTLGLAWTTAVDAQIAAIVKRYDDAVADQNIKNAGEIPAVAPGKAGYVGQTVCLGCHTDVAAFAAQDLHRNAWEGLVKTAKDKDLDCVPCHATGYGQPGGSLLGKMGSLTSVQCESCHGPGSLHVAAHKVSEDGPIFAHPDLKTCTTCHTEQHSPRFAFEAYRKRLLVPGHGMPGVH